MSKKLLSLLTVLGILLSCCALAPAYAQNAQNGEPDVSDVLTLKNIISQNEYANEYDLDGDGKCTLTDLSLLKAGIMGTALTAENNIALGKSAVVSSYTAETAASLSQLTDGNGNTFITFDESDTQKSVTVNLAGHYDINAVELYLDSDGFTQTDASLINIEVFADAHNNSEWTSVASSSSQSGGACRIEFLSAQAYSVKVVLSAEDKISLGDIGVYKTVINCEAIAAAGYTVDSTTNNGSEVGTVITASELTQKLSYAKKAASEKIKNKTAASLWFIGDSAFCGDVYFDNDSSNNSADTTDTLPYYTTQFLNEDLDTVLYSYINSAYFGRKVANIYSATQTKQNADITIIHAGFNDALPSNETGLEAFAQNLAKLLMREIARGSYVIYMKPIETPYFDSYENYEAEGNTAGMFAARSHDYADVAVSVCEALGVDVFDTPMAQGDGIMFARTMDTMHPNAEARSDIALGLSNYILSQAEENYVADAYLFKVGSVNGYWTTYDYSFTSAVACQFVGGVTYVPFRIISDAAGAKSVSFNSAAGTVTIINKYDMQFVLTMDSTACTATFNGTTQSGNLNAAPMYIDGQCCLPIRDVSNLTYASVTYTEQQDDAYVVVSSSALTESETAKCISLFK